MNKLIVLFVLVASSASATDIIKFKNGMIFNHKVHQADKVGKCSVCHDNIQVSEDAKTVTTTEPGKIKEFGKEWAHKYCTDCHELFGEGPITCEDCHKK